MNYDALNRVTLEQYSDGTTHTYTYDAVHNKLTSASPHGTYTSTFTNRNQVTTVTEPGGKVATHSYDAAGRRTAMNAYGQGEFLYGWDRAGRQTHVTNPHGKTTTLAYDPIGQLLQRYYPNRAVASHTYDGVGNLLSILNTHAGAVISSLTYGYGRARNRTHQREADGTLTNWTYDGIYQLTNELRAGGPAGTSFNFTHTYDGMGNRIAFHDGATLTTYTYSAANRLQLASAAGAVTTYTNDASGNRIQAQDPDSTTYYTWNAVGQMVSAEPPTGAVAFTYNAEGQRASKSDTSTATGFLYDHKNLLQETDGVGGDIDTTYCSTTDQEFGDLLGEFGQDEQYSMYDAQKCANAIVDANGTLLAQYKYQAFGSIAAVQVDGDTWARLTVYQSANMTLEQWSKLPVSATSAMMTFGQRQCYSDLELGLVYAGMGEDKGRFVDPLTTRFTSDDPIRQAGGNNVQQYVGNNPITNEDPSGHDYWYDYLNDQYNDARDQLREVKSLITIHASQSDIDAAELKYEQEFYTVQQTERVAHSHWWYEVGDRTTLMRSVFALPNPGSGNLPKEADLLDRIHAEQASYAAAQADTSWLAKLLNVGEDVLQGIEAGAIDAFKFALSKAGVDPNDFINDIKQLNGDLVTIVKAIIEHPKEIFHTLSTGVRKGFNSFFADTKTVLKHVLKVLGEMTSLPLTDVAEAIGKGGWKAVVDVGEIVLGKLGLTWDGLLGTIGEALGNSGMAVLGFVIEEVGEIIDSKSLWDWMKQKITQGEGLIKELWSTLKTQWVSTLETEIAKFLLTLLEDLVPAVGAVVEIYHTIQFVFTWASTLLGMVSTIKDSVMDAVNGLKEDSIAARVTGVLESVLSSMFKGLLTFLGIGDLPGKIAKGVDAAGNWVKDQIKKLVHILAMPVLKLFEDDNPGGKDATTPVEGEDGASYWVERDPTDHELYLMRKASKAVRVKEVGGKLKKDAETSISLNKQKPTKEIAKQASQAKKSLQEDIKEATKGEKNPIQKYEVVTYKESVARSIVGDKLTGDHIPQFAVLVAYVEKKLGRELTEDEKPVLKDNAYTVVIDADLHTAGRTYGRNDETEIGNDAKDLTVAEEKDEAVHLKNASRFGYSTVQLTKSFFKLNALNAVLFKKLSTKSGIASFFEELGLE